MLPLRQRVLFVEKPVPWFLHDAAALHDARLTGVQYAPMRGVGRLKSPSFHRSMATGGRTDPATSGWRNRVNSIEKWAADLYSTPNFTAGKASGVDVGVR